MMVETSQSPLIAEVLVRMAEIAETEPRVVTATQVAAGPLYPEGGAMALTVSAVSALLYLAMVDMGKLPVATPELGCTCARVANEVVGRNAWGGAQFRTELARVLREHAGAPKPS